MLSLLSTLEEGSEEDDDEDDNFSRQYKYLLMFPAMEISFQACKLAVKLGKVTFIYVQPKQALKLAVMVGDILSTQAHLFSSKFSINLELVISFLHEMEDYVHIIHPMAKDGQIQLMKVPLELEGARGYQGSHSAKMGMIQFSRSALENEQEKVFPCSDFAVFSCSRNSSKTSIDLVVKQINEEIETDKHSFKGGYVEGNVSLLFFVFKLGSRGSVHAKTPLEVPARNIGKYSSVLELGDGSLKFPFDAQTFCVILSPSKVKDGEGRTLLEVPFIMANIQSISCTSLDKENQLKLRENIFQGLGDNKDAFDLFKSKGALVLKFVNVHSCFYVHGHGEKVETSHGEEEFKERDLVLRQPSYRAGFSHAIFMDALEVAGEDNGSEDAHKAEGGFQLPTDVLAPDGMKNTSKAKGHYRPLSSYGQHDIGPMDHTQKTWSLSAHISRHVPQDLGCREDSPNNSLKQRNSRLWDTPTEKPRPRIQELTCLRHVAVDEVKHGSFCHARLLKKEWAFSDMLLQISSLYPKVHVLGYGSLLENA